MNVNSALSASLKDLMGFVNQLTPHADYITPKMANVLAAMMDSNYKTKNVRLMLEMYLILIVHNGRMENALNALMDHFSQKQGYVRLLILCV